jgi:ribosomal-protein-alanine N-acetyltransferase
MEPWFQYLSQPEVFEHTSWNVQDSSELLQYAWTPEAFDEASPLRFAVALKSSDALVGTAGFHSVSPGDRRAEIAYDIAPNHWGKGIASAVCAALVAWAHAEAGVIRVQATVLESNVRSIAVLERCGFRREGFLHSYRRVRSRHGNFWMYAHLAPSAGA